MKSIEKRKLHIWNPNKELSGPLHLEEFKYSNGLYIKFVDEMQRDITFVYDQSINGRYILASRFADEFIRNDLGQIAFTARKDFFGNEVRDWYTYKMTNSDFRVVRYTTRTWE